MVTSGGALNKSQKQTQSFVVDIGKQMKMGDHLVKLLPPSQSWRRRKKRMMLANAVGKRSLMFGGGGGGGANTGNSGGSKNLTKVGVASKRKEDVDGTTEKGKMEKNSVKKENEIGARNTNTEDNNNTDNDDKNNRFGREHIDLDSEPEDDAGDEDRLALGNEGGGNGTVNNNATTTGTTMNNDTNNNNGRMQQQQQQQSQPQQLSQMDGTSFMGLDEHDLTDCCFRVEDEYFRAHKIILSARSRVFAAMLRAGWKMREGTEGVIALKETTTTTTTTATTTHNTQGKDSRVKNGTAKYYRNIRTPRKNQYVVVVYEVRFTFNIIKPRDECILLNSLTNQLQTQLTKFGQFAEL